MADNTLQRSDASNNFKQMTVNAAAALTDYQLFGGGAWEISAGCLELIII